MSYVYNPFTGTLDNSGGSGGGASLPSGTGSIGSSITTSDTGALAYTKQAGISDIMIIEDDFVYEYQSSPIQTPWLSSNNNGSIRTTTFTSANVGVWQLASNNTAGDEAGIIRGAGGNGGQTILGGGVHQIVMYIQLPVLATGAEDFIFTCGLGSNLGAFQNNEPGTDGVYFQYNRSSSVNWIAGTRASNVTTTVATGIPVSTSYVQLRFDINAAASLVTFYINGTSVGTSTTNIPTVTSIGPGFKIRKTVGTSIRGVNVDYFRWYLRMTTPRF